jgi:hypothetical protein
MTRSLHRKSVRCLQVSTTLHPRIFKVVYGQHLRPLGIIWAVVRAGEVATYVGF